MGTQLVAPKFGEKIDPLKLRVPTPISGVPNAAPYRRQSALLRFPIVGVVPEIPPGQVGRRIPEVVRMARRVRARCPNDVRAREETTSGAVVVLAKGDVTDRTGDDD